MADAASLLEGGKAGASEDAPLSLRQEIKRTLALAVPISTSQVLTFAAYLITTAQVGHMSSLDLSALTLARTFFHITGMSLVCGMGSGMSTLCGQAFGARQYSMVGATLQRAVVLCLLTTLPVLVLWTQAKPILLYLGQDEVIVGLAVTYVAHLVPALLLVGCVQCMRNYFSSQGVVLPLTLVAFLTSAATPVVNVLLVLKLGLGVDGAAIAYGAIYALELSLLGGATVWLHRRQPPAVRTWVPLSRQAALSGWGPYLKIALPSLLMICLDWWYYEVMVLIAGAQKDARLQLGSMGVCFSTHALAFMLAEGFAGAASTRVSNELGAGNGPRARLASLVSLVGGAVALALCAVGLVAARGPWCRIFTTDPDIIRIVSDAMPYMAASLVSDSINTVLSGVLTGAGRQLLGATMNLSFFWCLGVPLAVWLAPRAGGTVGLWMAMLCVSMLQALALSVAVARFSWRDEALRAQQRVNAGGASRAGGNAGGGGGFLDAAAAAAVHNGVHGCYEPPLVDAHGASCLSGRGPAHAGAGAVASACADASETVPLLEPAKGAAV